MQKPGFHICLFERGESNAAWLDSCSTFGVWRTLTLELPDSSTWWLATGDLLFVGCCCCWKKDGDEQMPTKLVDRCGRLALVVGVIEHGDWPNKTGCWWRYISYLYSRLHCFSINLASLTTITPLSRRSIKLSIVMSVVSTPKEGNKSWTIRIETSPQFE